MAFSIAELGILCSDDFLIILKVLLGYEDDLNSKMKGLAEGGERQLSWNGKYPGESALKAAFAINIQLELQIMYKLDW